MSIDNSEKWPSWGTLLYNYYDDPVVKQLIFVQYLGGSSCRVQLYAKSEEYPKVWTKLLVCSGFVGRNGIGKEKEGDMKTPIGEFGIRTAFGIKDNPGTSLPYIKADEHIYTVAAGPYYNQLVDDRNVPQSEIEKYEGELILETSPQFNYGFFSTYNEECKPGKGSYIFFHCDGPNDFTAGCVAVSEENMKFILQHIDINARLCIYPLVH